MSFELSIQPRRHVGGTLNVNKKRVTMRNINILIKGYLRTVYFDYMVSSVEFHI